MHNAPAIPAGILCLGPQRFLTPHNPSYPCLLYLRCGGCRDWAAEQPPRHRPEEGGLPAPQYLGWHLLAYTWWIPRRDGIKNGVRNIVESNDGDMDYKSPHRAKVPFVIQYAFAVCSPTPPMDQLSNDIVRSSLPATRTPPTHTLLFSHLQHVSQRYDLRPAAPWERPMILAECWGRKPLSNQSAKLTTEVHIM